MNNKKKFGVYTKIWKLNNTLVNKSKKISHHEIRKYLRWKKIKHKILKLIHAAKAVFKERELAKEEQVSSKANRGRN